MATKSVFDTKYSPTKSTANKLKPLGKASAGSLAKKDIKKSTPTNKTGSTAKKPTGILNANVSSAIKKLTTVPKTPVTKPTPKKTSVVAAAKPTMKAVGTGKVSSIAAATAGKGSTKKETFNLDAEVKKTMSGAYGSGEARKKALGANYAAVQAEINKRSAANKPKTSTAPKSTATTPAKSERVEIGSLPLKKVTEIQTSSSKPSQIITKSGGSGLGAKEKTDKEMAKIGFRKGGMVKRKMMTGGMVNPNAKVSYQKIAGSKGVTSGVNAKASASKYASSKGSGKANTPPSKATPAAKRGGAVKMKRGGMIKRK